MFVQPQFKRHHLNSYNNLNQHKRNQQQLPPPPPATAASIYDSSASFGSNSSNGVSFAGVGGDSAANKLLARRQNLISVASSQTGRRSSHVPTINSEAVSLSKEKRVKQVSTRTGSNENYETKDDERARNKTRRQASGGDEKQEVEIALGQLGLRRRRSKISDSQTQLIDISGDSKFKKCYTLQDINQNYNCDLVELTNEQPTTKYFIEQQQSVFCDVCQSTKPIVSMKSSSTIIESNSEHIPELVNNGTNTTTTTTTTEVDLASIPGNKSNGIGVESDEHLKKATSADVTTQQNKQGIYNRRVASFSGYSRKNLEFLSSFCLSFILYQLETWKQLVEDTRLPTTQTTLALQQKPSQNLKSPTRNMVTLHDSMPLLPDELDYDRFSGRSQVDQLTSQLNAKMILNDNHHPMSSQSISGPPPSVHSTNGYHPTATCDCGGHCRPPVDSGYATMHLPLQQLHGRQRINRVVTSPIIDTSGKILDLHQQLQTRYSHQEYAEGHHCQESISKGLSGSQANYQLDHQHDYHYQSYLSGGQLMKSPPPPVINQIYQHNHHNHQLEYIRAPIGQTNSSPATVSLARHSQPPSSSILTTMTNRGHSIANFSLRGDTPLSTKSTNYNSSSSLDYELDHPQQTHSLNAMSTQPPARIPTPQRTPSLRQQSQQYPQSSLSVDFDYRRPNHHHQHYHNHHHNAYAFHRQHKSQMRDDYLAYDHLHANYKQQIATASMRDNPRSNDTNLQDVQDTNSHSRYGSKLPKLRSQPQDKNHSHAVTMGSDSELYSINRLKLQSGQDRLHYVHMPNGSLYHNNHYNKARGTSSRSSACSTPFQKQLNEQNINANSATSTPNSNGQTSSVLQQSKSVDLASSSSTPSSQFGNITQTSKKYPSSIARVSLAGAKKRLGFKQKGGLNSLSIHRSEEVLPAELIRQRFHRFIAVTTGGGGVGGDSSGSLTGMESNQEFRNSYLDNNSPFAFGKDPRNCFVEGLGVGQIASRQALVSPYLGDIQLSLSDRRGMFEVEVIRARRLQHKPDAKRLPSPYVKVYLMREKKCLAKFKTEQAKETLEPLYQQQFIFREFDYKDCVLQVIVWGDYGKRDKKVLMGIVQVHLNDVNIKNTVIGWYRLFNAPAMASCVMSSSKMLRQTISATTLGQEVIVEQSSFESQTS